jgi:uncharacterized membrane protein
MKRIILVTTMILLVSLVFAKGPTDGQLSSSIARVENSSESHAKNIEDMEASLLDTDRGIEYNDLLQRLQNKGGAMSWQKYLFEQAGKRADKDIALAEYKKLSKEYDELVAKLKSFK